jgi:hypothetical protein
MKKMLKGNEVVQQYACVGLLHVPLSALDSISPVGVADIFFIRAVGSGCVPGKAFLSRYRERTTINIGISLKGNEVVQQYACVGLLHVPLSALDSISPVGVAVASPARVKAVRIFFISMLKCWVLGCFFLR